MAPGFIDRSKLTRPQIALLAALAAGAILLLYLARARAHWPWFSVWMLLVLAVLGALTLPSVRRFLNLSWFGVTLVTLTGVCIANLFLIYVERHRQRSERLEVRGAWVEPGRDPLTVGVGVTGLDVHLEGDPYRMDRWSVSLEADTGGAYRVTDARNVEMLRVRRGEEWGFRAGRMESVIGRELRAGAPLPLETANDPDASLDLLDDGPRGRLAWAGSEASLTLDDPLLSRMFGRRLNAGVQLAELDWNGPVDRERAEDFVLTMVRPARRLGRLTLTKPVYRLVSRRSPDLDERVRVEIGDTLWVRSRGSSWAFALDRVPEVSRVAAPLAVMFVRRPRPTGWALPSAEACGDAVDRCGIISSGPLPPPQAHFDLSGFGLDGRLYGVTARLETSANGVRVVMADETEEFGYGETRPIQALPLEEGAPDAGYLLRVHRTSTAGQRAILMTVVGLYVMFVSALLVLLGNTQLARRLRTDSPNTSAAWTLLNLFLVFLGIRLALGLRVAYAAPFYDRAAATSVGLWIAFAIMLVLLGRWSSWTPRFWHAVRRVEQPVTRLLAARPGTAPGAAPHESASAGSPERHIGGHTGEDAPRRGDRRGDRMMSGIGLAGFVASLAGLVWQRPEAGLGIVVAAIGIGAWLAHGLFGSYRAIAGQRPGPLAVLTSDALGLHPSRTFLVAAGASVVLALAIQAPIVALVPVVALLLLFAGAWSMERSGSPGNAGRRAWTLYGLVAAGMAAAMWIFVGFGPVPAGALAIAAAGGAVLLGRSHPAEGPAESRSRLLVWHDGILEIGRSAFSGVGWVGVLAGLAGLVFLNFRTIPPFVRFALVFLLFLLAVRAGLVCRRVLDEDGGGSASALGLLVIPVGVLLVFMLFDFGLGLVFFLPMMLTVLLAVGVNRMGRTLTAGSVALLLAVFLSAWSVLRPTVAGLEDAPTLTEYSEEFGGVGNGFVDLLRRAGLGTPVTRATVRSIAASDPALIEEALAYSGPSEALFAAAPSLEQAWGGQAYAASGWTGTGFAGTTALGRGVPTVVSYAENTFSVYVLSEHGAVGGLVVLLAYLSLLVAVGVWTVRVKDGIHLTPDGLAVLAITIGGVLWLTLPAAYVAGSNLALLPLTGQNMPFLGLNSWADVVLVSGIGTGIFAGLTGLSGIPGSRS